MHPKMYTTAKAAHPMGNQSFSWQQSCDSGLEEGKRYIDKIFRNTVSSFNTA